MKYCKAIGTNNWFRTLIIIAIGAGIIFYYDTRIDECSDVVISNDLLQKASPSSYKNGAGISYKDIEEIRSAVNSLDICKSKSAFAIKENKQAAKQLNDSLIVLESDLLSLSIEEQTKSNQVPEQLANKRKAIAEILKSINLFLESDGKK